MKLTTVLTIAALFLFAAVSARAQDDKVLASKALRVLEEHCRGCHGANGSNKGGVNYIGDVKKMLQNELVVPRKPDDSRVVVRLKDEGDPMPPLPPKGPAKRPTKEEIETVVAWVAAGAGEPDGTQTVVVPPPPAAERGPKDTLAVLKAIHTDLHQTVLVENRAYQRYFTLTNLFNTPSVPATQLQVYRAALAKVINSLSWRGDIIVPRPLDPEGTILAIDIRDLDWDRYGLWDEVMSSYPYGLTHERYPQDRDVNNLALQISDLMGGVSLPYVRADWFISTASRPPLYHTLLYDKVLPELVRRRADYPWVNTTDPNRADFVNTRDPGRKNFNPKLMTARDLEERLAVDVGENLRRGTAKRAGFTISGVSAQNRLVERHPANYGAYWKSYDYKVDNARNNLFQFPLGPAEFVVAPIGHPTRSSKFPAMAFHHDGGEVIFSLPNGMQGYLLVDGKDRRIDEGPTDVVRDDKQLLGTPLVTNGISCMACHTRGMKSGFKDEVARSSRAGGTALDKVRQVYVDAVEMNKLLQRDEKRYLTAVDAATGLFLRGSGQEQIEAVSAIARPFLAETLTATQVAVELGLFADGKPNAEKVKAVAETNAELRGLGLATLANGGTISRADWESRRNGQVTPFQVFARILLLGTPQN